MDRNHGSYHKKGMTLRRALNEFVRHVAINFHRARLVDKAVYLIGVGQSESWLGRCGMLVADQLDGAPEIQFPVFGGTKVPVSITGLSRLVGNIRKGDPGAYVVVVMGVPCYSDQEAGTLRAYPGSLAGWISFGTPFADAHIDLLITCAVDIRDHGAGFLVDHAAAELAGCLKKAALTYKSVKGITTMSLKSVERYNERVACDQLTEAAYDLREALWASDDEGEEDEGEEDEM